MSDSVDIFKLNETHIIVHIAYGNQENTTTHAITWNTIKTIQITKDHAMIYHGGIITKFSIQEAIILDD